MKFESLGLIRPILKALRAQGYQTPTPIQEQAIPAALAGRDVLGCARTGTGKTCAFAAPILQRLSAAPRRTRSIRALVLAPTRELAIQDYECFVAYGANLKLKSAVVFGGVGQTPQVDAIQAGCDILVATPGRLEDLHAQGYIDVSALEILVLDEADRMLDMGFIHDVKKILAWLPQQKQTLFFSATMPPEITLLVDSLLRNPVKISVDPVSSPVEVIDQSVYQVDKANKTALLVQLLREKQLPSALVFTRTKHGANRVAQELERAGISAAAIHGNKSQTARQAALAGFKDGSIQALVATDIAARGLDIEDLACVFNYNLPEVPETYIHRIGRTGRAGKGGIAISFCDWSEKPLLRDIEKLIGKSVPCVEGHPFPMQVFEAPKKDARGRVINAEDAEARAAARKKKKETASKAEKAAKPTALERQRANEQPDQKPGAPVVQAAPPTAPERKFKRPERKPMSALDELAPLPAPQETIEPVYGEKRTGHLRNTFFTPEEQRLYSGEPEPLMDATARMFSTRRSIPARYQEPERKKADDSRDGKKPRQKKKTQEATASQRKHDSKRKKTAPDAETAVIEQPAVVQSAATEKSRKKKKKHHAGDRPLPQHRSIYGAHKKDSTEQAESLMKPYYLSDSDE